jgi:hypothetical protein
MKKGDKEVGVDVALEREISRIRIKIAKRMHQVEGQGSNFPLSGSMSVSPGGFIGFKERSFHEDEVNPSFMIRMSHASGFKFYALFQCFRAAEERFEIQARPKFSGASYISSCL